MTNAGEVLTLKGGVAVMYSKGFVIAIIVDGKISEESKDGLVTLPFGVEYTLRLRNKNNRRAVAKVFIDDENVSEDGIVVQANHYVDLERPVSKAVKFKFVSSKSEEAIDHGKNNKTDGSNGVIRVEWLLEKEVKYVAPRLPVTIIHNYPPPPPIYPKWYEHPPIWMGEKVCGGEVPATYSMRGVSGQSMASNEASKGLMSHDTLGRRVRIEEGCTVEGERSNQNFTTVYVDVEDGPPVIIQLVLRGFNPEITQVLARDKFCDKCGAKVNAKANFCSSCGNKIRRVRKHA